MIDFLDKLSAHVLPITAVLGAYVLGTGQATNPLFLTFGVVFCTTSIYLKLLMKA